MKTWKEVSPYSGQSMEEDAPTNAAGGGAIAGLGVDKPGYPGSGEPGVKKKKKKEDLPRYRQPIYDDPEIKGRGRAPLPADSEDPRLRALKKMGIDPRMKKKDGGAFPDLSGDGKVTQKDILIGRGVIKKKMGGIARGGGAAIQGTGFKGVY